jgi:hypothetical protein
MFDDVIAYKIAPMMLKIERITGTANATIMTNTLFQPDAIMCAIFTCWCCVPLTANERWLVSNLCVRCLVHFELNSI